MIGNSPDQGGNDMEPQDKLVMLDGLRFQTADPH